MYKLNDLFWNIRGMSDCDSFHHYKKVIKEKAATDAVAVAAAVSVRK